VVFGWLSRLSGGRRGKPQLILSATLYGLGLVTCAAGQAEIIELSTDKPKQGQTVELFVPGELPTAVSTEAEFNGQNYKLFPTDSVRQPAGYQTLIAIPADLEPGPALVKCGAAARRLVVVSGKFPTQKITLPKAKDNFEASAGEKEAIERAKSTLSAKRMWSTRFLPPSRARVSAVFGLKRIVNGKLLDDYFHSGLDYAAALGSPVSASAPGRVVLAASGFRLHGNTVAIDHGQGVVSFYIHLQKLMVKPGQTVKAGEVIGRVGQTGRASGPHLHFSLYVNQVATNPGDWFNRVF